MGTWLVPRWGCVYSDEWKRNNRTDHDCEKGRLQVSSEWWCFPVPSNYVEYEAGAR